MKKILTAVLTAIILVPSCQKALDTRDITPAADGTITISVIASLPDYGNSTKGSLVNTVRLAWSEGDAVYVYDNEKCLGTLTASLEDGTDKYAVLSGTIVSSVADKLTLVVASDEMKPNVATQGEAIQNGITFDLSTQDQTGAPYVAYAVIDKPADSQLSGIKTAFQLATSVIKVNCTGAKSGCPVAQVRIKGVNTELRLVPSASEAPVVSSSEGSGMITRTNASSFAGVSGEGIMSFSVAVLQQAATSDRKIYVSQEGYPCSASFSAAALTKGLSYNTVAQVCGPYKTVGGHSGVRLWEDGPYWATCNIGAENPYESGWHFMWGGLQAYEHKDGKWYKAGTNVELVKGFDGDWSNYRFGTYDIEAGTTGYGFSKYPKDPATGLYDLWSLELIDDAAAISWGSGWRTPDSADFDGLESKCTLVWISDGDVVGALFSGSGDYAGVSVFFPAAGYGLSDELRSVGGYGNYWSRDLHSEYDVLSATSMWFRNDTMNSRGYDVRNKGLSIRPVTD